MARHSDIVETAIDIAVIAGFGLFVYWIWTKYETTPTRGEYSPQMIPQGAEDQVGSFVETGR